MCDGEMHVWYMHGRPVEGFRSFPLLLSTFPLQDRKPEAHCLIPAVSTANSQSLPVSDSHPQCWG